MSEPANTRPSAADAARRFLILRHQFVYAQVTPPAEIIAGLSAEDRAQLSDGYREIAEQIRAALDAAGLWKILSDAERAFFKTPGPELDPQTHVNALWRAEAAGCLMWGLNLLDAIPPYDTEIDSDLLTSAADEGAEEFIRGAVLRPAEEVDQAREIAEMWHWRSRTRQLEERGFDPSGSTQFKSLDEIVRLSAAHAAEGGVIPGTIKGDFPAFDKAYRDLDEEEWSVIRSITMERHFAFNWLCGLAPENNWEATPTDT